MPVKVNFQFNTAQTIMKIEGAAKRAVGTTAQQVLADCNEFIPADQWVLRDSSLIHTSLENSMKHASLTPEQQKILDEAPGSDLPNGKLVWQTPYARFLYHGVVMIDPKTRSTWAREGQSKIVKSPEKELSFDKSKNPKAGSHWCERAQADCGEDWKKIYEKAFKEELNK